MFKLVTLGVAGVAVLLGCSSSLAHGWHLRSAGELEGVAESGGGVGLLLFCAPSRVGNTGYMAVLHFPSVDDASIARGTRRMVTFEGGSTLPVTVQANDTSGLIVTTQFEALLDQLDDLSSAAEPVTVIFDGRPTVTVRIAMTEFRGVAAPFRTHCSLL